MDGLLHFDWRVPSALPRRATRCVSQRRAIAQVVSIHAGARLCHWRADCRMHRPFDVGEEATRRALSNSRYGSISKNSLTTQAPASRTIPRIALNGRVYPMISAYRHRRVVPLAHFVRRHDLAVEPRFHAKTARGQVSYCRALAVARRQSTRFFELLVATSHARLWPGQGKRTEGHNLLSPIYGWFTEGLDAPMVRDAKTLLDELARCSRYAEVNRPRGTLRRRDAAWPRGFKIKDLPDAIAAAPRDSGLPRRPRDFGPLAA
jgi:hypothetical protein